MNKNNYKQEFMAIAKKLEPGFELTASNKKLIQLLTAYFQRNKWFDTQGFLLSKGVLLSGPIGTGKTLLMQIFKEYFKGFGMVTTRHIARDFVNKDIGVKIIDRYGRDCFAKEAAPQGEINVYTNPITYCFDDLGLEDTNSTLYGNKTSVIADILMDRYEHFKKHGMITHATTNLTPEKLTEIYGERMTDRINEMMNVIILDGKSWRK